MTIRENGKNRENRVGKGAPGPNVSDHSKSLLAAIVESSNDAIISKNLDGIITSWNDAAGKMFGYTAEEMVGQSILRLIPEALHPEEDAILAKIREGGKIAHYETTRVTKSGQIVDVSVTISPVRNEEGEIVGASKIARDISERKRMQRVLIRAEKLAANGRLAATVAHEINNPLEAALNLIYLARRSSEADTKLHEYLTGAEAELQLVSEIARKTLGCYREAAPPVSVYLPDLIEEVLRGYQSRIRSGGIGVDCRYGDQRRIELSREDFLQVFSNIVANSIDAMPGGGTLRIEIEERATSGGDGIEVMIRDNGSGIAREHRERVFEPFFTTRGNLATGIGLWVARELVEKRGGRITLTSSTDPANRGTTICVFIPFAMRQPDI